MAEREPRQLPDWAAQERAGDMGWIREHVLSLRMLAEQGYQAQGRGAVVVDTTSVIDHPDGQGHPVGYFGQALIHAELQDEHTLQLLREYQPQHEFVATLLKTEDRVSSYRLRLVEHPRDPIENRVDPAPDRAVDPEEAPAAEAELQPPDLETLQEWVAQGFCEATDGCIVEPDGTCPHGHPSWLLKLGLI